MKSTQLLASEVQDFLKKGIGEKSHWCPVDVPLSELASVLIGMANSSGGTVLIGVSPRSGNIHGVADTNEAIDRVFHAILLSDPTLILPIPRIVNVNHSKVVWVTVPSGLPHVYNLDGRYLVRQGSRTNPINARKLRQLLLERGVVQLESQVPPMVTIDDLDPQKITAYLEKLNFPGDPSFEEVLLRRGCLRVDNGKTGAGKGKEQLHLRPTYAGLLLFGKQPQQWLPNATILAVHFTGTQLADRFIKQEISGSLPDQLHQAEIFVRENIHSMVNLEGLTHEETSEYPLEAIRELLVNAVAHRDYNLQGDNIHLNIYADRIEVHSPGNLPGPITLENLLEARFSRNAVIMQALSDLGFVERLGYGLNRVVNVMRQNGLQAPKFEEKASSFRVTLNAPIHDPGQGSKQHPMVADQHMLLNIRQQKALNYLFLNRRITNRDYQDLCPDVHSETLRRDLVDLVQRDIVIKIGDKRATYYILKK